MWPARPALDRKKRPQVGQGTVGAMSVADAALAFRIALFFLFFKIQYDITFWFQNVNYHYT